jgi:hypothetical protein
MSNPYMERWEGNRDEFHRVMGSCIAAWAQVDDQLFRIFRSCIGPYDQSAVIYYRTPGLDVRLALVDEIVITTSFAKSGKARLCRPPDQGLESSD